MIIREFSKMDSKMIPPFRLTIRTFFPEFFDFKTHSNTSAENTSLQTLEVYEINSKEITYETSGQDP